LRNHGESPHSPVHNYESMADDVAAFIEEHKFNKTVIMGHSMYEFFLTYCSYYNKKKITNNMSIHIGEEE
jgi:pimeloyl-ACP methyl ester carboxylesterase